MDVIYVDFRKAFDKDPHKRLMVKVNAHGIVGKIWGWIDDWLCSRMQQVILNDRESNLIDVLSGVPQGSVLGPVLFVISINDINSYVSSKILKFANDTKIVGVFSRPEGVMQLRQDLVDLYRASNDWLMLFNTEKCKVMHLGNKNPCVKYDLGGPQLESILEEKDLGILLTKDPKVSAQCLREAKTANRVLGMIRRTFTCNDEQTIIQSINHWSDLIWSTAYRPGVLILVRILKC